MNTDTKNLTKIEQFRQLKNTIRYNEKTLIVALDVGKTESRVFVTDSFKHNYLNNYKLRHELENVQELERKVQEIKSINKKDEVVWAMEPTGNYHKPLAGYLIRQGYTIVGINTVAAKENRKSTTGRWTKTDAIDAINIGDMVSQGKMFFYRNDELNEELRTLLKYRYQLGIDLGKIKIQLRNNHFALYFPEIDGYYKDILHSEIIKILKYYPTAEQIRGITFKKFYACLKFKKTNKIQQLRIKEVWQRAQTSLGLPFNPTVLLYSHLTLETITRVKKQLTIIDNQIEKLSSQSEDQKWLLQIPGFGIYTSAIFIAEVGNVQNYKVDKQLIRLAGLDLEHEQSGNFQSRKRISKKGKILLRWALSQAFNKALRNKTIGNYFLERVRLLGGSSEARAKLKIKLVEKFLRSIFAVLKYKRAFDVREFVGLVNEPVHRTVRA